MGGVGKLSSCFKLSGERIFIDNNISGKLIKRKGGAFSIRETLGFKGKYFGSGKIQFYGKNVEDDSPANVNLKQISTVRLILTKHGPFTVYRLLV